MSCEKNIPLQKVKLRGNVNNVPSNATGFDHKLGGRYFE